MKAIINGTRYDTNKAITIGTFDNIGAGASSCTDFQYWEATLYVTPKSKKYFLAGEGGPMSQFSPPIDQNSWSGGSKVIPLPRTEAFEWAQRYLDTDTVEEFFGDLIQDA
jgi:hypothetical protein